MDKGEEKRVRTDSGFLRTNLENEVNGNWSTGKRRGWKWNVTVQNAIEFQIYARQRNTTWNYVESYV